MLRNMSSSLLASYFATVEKKREAKMDLSWVLVQQSRLFLIAVSFLKRTVEDRAGVSDTTANNLIVQNLAYAVCNLHVLIRRSTSSHEFWSSNIHFFKPWCHPKGFELLFWFSNEVKQLAEGVRDKLRDLIYWRGEIRPKSPEEPQGEAGEQKAVREDYCSRRPRTGAAWEHKRRR
jgi:hypothetical protein